MGDPHGLREQRWVGAKKLVPDRVKTVPKRVQTGAMNAHAHWARRAVQPTDAVLITSSGRSGSTWLFEQLASDPSVLPLFEPFHPVYSPGCSVSVDPLGQVSVPDDPDAEARLRHTVDEVFAGRCLSRWSMYRSPRRRVRAAPRTLVKCIRTNRMLDWLVDQVSVPTVLLVRHPCAVVESMLRSPGEWGTWPVTDVDAAIRSSMARLGEPVPPGVVTDDRAQFLAALWAVEVRAAMAALRDHPAAMVVTYEELATDPVAHIARIASAFGLRDLQADPGRPSFVTDVGSPLRSGLGAVEGWRERLSAAQVDLIVRTVRDLGVDFYSHDPMPDLAARDRAVLSG